MSPARTVALLVAALLGIASLGAGLLLLAREGDQQVAETAGGPSDQPGDRPSGQPDGTGEASDPPAGVTGSAPPVPALDDDVLAALGCTGYVRMPDLGGGHIPGATEALEAEVPSVIYGSDEPPSSGRHLGQVVATGVYDVPIDPRLTTHNLEHGHVVAHHAPDAPAEQVEALRAWARAAIDEDFPKLVVAPYYTDLSGGAMFSFTAWFTRQTCDTFDVRVAEAFAEGHHETSDAPEASVPAHRPGQPGVLEPDGAPLLFRPLDLEGDTI